MSEVKAQGASERIWATPEKKNEAGKHYHMYRGMLYATEYIPADIARELAGALHSMLLLDDEFLDTPMETLRGLNDSKHATDMTRAVMQSRIALAKWREVTEEKE